MQNDCFRCHDCPFFRPDEGKPHLGRCSVRQVKTYDYFECYFWWEPADMLPIEAERILHEHNKWRRGCSRKPMMSPALLGIALDTTIRLLRQQRRSSKT